MLDYISADSRVSLWVTRTWTDNQLSGVQRDQLFDADLIIAVNVDLRPLKHEVLVDIPSERIEIVDNDNF